MSARYPIPRSHPGRPVRRWSRPLPPLSDGRLDVVAFTKHNPRWEPILSLYDAVCGGYGPMLYGSLIMGGGLVLSARSDVEHDEGVIVVSFDPRKHRFSLSYRHRDVQPEHSEDCSEEEIRERLRLFLAYKFGLHIKPKERPDQTVRRMPLRGIADLIRSPKIIYSMRFILGLLFVGSALTFLAAQTVTVVPSAQDKVKWALMTSAASICISMFFWFRCRKRSESKAN